MSFNYNPYRHIEIVQNDNGRWTWNCDSCGGDGNTAWESSSSMDLVIDDYHAHVLRSHGRTPADFESWSKY